MDIILHDLNGYLQYNSPPALIFKD